MAQSAQSIADAVVTSVTASIDAAKGHDAPYRHWFLSHCLPEAAVKDLLALPFAAPALGGVSGKRELHNNTRKYFDTENQGQYAVVDGISQALQSRAIVNKVEQAFGSKLAGSYLRIEHAQDIDGFWLEPHTDLGVKLFTMLLYLSPDASHQDLGTDIYDADKKHAGRSPFTSNAAMVFVPSNITYHGFEPRKIEGVRKSIIINYVTSDWRAREQLAYPATPVA
jgi:hypothetical protein